MDLAQRLEKVASLIEAGIGSNTNPSSSNTPSLPQRGLSDDKKSIYMAAYLRGKTASYMDAFAEAARQGAL